MKPAYLNWLAWFVMSVVPAALTRFLWSLRVKKLEAALVGSAGHEQCVACSSRDLEVLGEAAYRCRACGYEGGSGLAAVRAGRAPIDPATPEGRASVFADLEEAARFFDNAISSLDVAMAGQPNREETVVDAGSAIAEARRGVVRAKSVTLLADPRLDARAIGLDRLNGWFFRQDSQSLDQALPSRTSLLQLRDLCTLARDKVRIVLRDRAASEAGASAAPSPRVP